MRYLRFSNISTRRRAHSCRSVKKRKRLRKTVFFFFYSPDFEWLVSFRRCFRSISRSMSTRFYRYTRAARDLKTNGRNEEDLQYYDNNRDNLSPVFARQCTTSFRFHRQSACLFLREIDAVSHDRRRSIVQCAPSIILIIVTTD